MLPMLELKWHNGTGIGRLLSDFFARITALNSSGAAGRVAAHLAARKEYSHPMSISPLFLHSTFHISIFRV